MASSAPRFLPTLYLDFDGVVHPDAVFIERGGRIVLRRDGIALFEWSPLLVQALAPHPDVRIVLSTSWVRVTSFDYAKSQLPPELQRRVIGATYHTRMREGCENRRYATEPFALLSRFKQIHQHVQRHGVERWLAIDDDAEHWPDGHRANLVETDGELGLAEPGKVEELARKLELASR